MNAGSRALLATGAFALVARMSAGCATTDEVETSNVGNPDGGSTVTPPSEPSTDGGVTDAAGDADAAANVCTSEGWCYTSLPTADSYDSGALFPDPSGINFALRSVWIAPDSRVWAVSTVGHVLLWDGSSWRVAALVDASLRTIWGSSATDLWVGGERGVILRGTVSGNDVTFQPVSIGTTKTIARIVGTSASDVWALPDAQDSVDPLNFVFHFTAESATKTPAFVRMTVPSTYPSPGSVRVQAIWLAGSSLWLGGYEHVFASGTFQDELIAMKWNGQGDAGPAWDQIPLLRGYESPIAAGTTSTDGVQLLAIQHSDDEARVARIAMDDSLLDASAVDPANPDGGIAHEGPYAWTSEIAHSFSAPNGIWASDRNEIWLIGKSGVIRHFDGTAWRGVPLALTNVTPLLQDLYDIQAVTTPSGERDMWVVGDDVALRRKVKP